MKRLVLLLLNLLMPMILFAASNDLCFRHFSVEDGLSIQFGTCFNAR